METKVGDKFIRRRNDGGADEIEVLEVFPDNLMHKWFRCRIKDTTTGWERIQDLKF